jgi:hypothetical protein
VKRCSKRLVLHAAPTGAWLLVILEGYRHVAPPELSLASLSGAATEGQSGSLRITARSNAPSMSPRSWRAMLRHRQVSNL